MTSNPHHQIPVRLPHRRPVQPSETCAASGASWSSTRPRSRDKLGELLKAALAAAGADRCGSSAPNGIGNPFQPASSTTPAPASAAKKPASIASNSSRRSREGLYQRVCAAWASAGAKGRVAWVEEVYELYGDASGEELDVIPSSGEGAFLSSILIEARMHDAPVLRWSCSNEFATYDDHRRWRDCQDWIEGYLDPVLSALNPHLTHHYGMDFGRSVDLSVIATLAVESNLVRRCRSWSSFATYRSSSKSRFCSMCSIACRVSPKAPMAGQQ